MVDPQLLMPPRDEGLIGRITRTLFGSPPAQQQREQSQDTTGTGVLVALLNQVDQTRVRMDRWGVYADVDEMDETSEEISVALDIVADDTVSSEDGETRSFTLISENATVQKVLDDTNQRTGLWAEAYAYVRNLVKYGDSFAEIVVDDQGEVVELRQLPPLSMHRNEQPNGQLCDGEPRYAANGECLNTSGECAFEQRDPGSDRVVAAFYAWQIVHCRLNWDGLRKYGRSHLRTTRIIWRKLKAIDEAIIIGRLSRAWPKNLHKLDTTGLSPADAEAALQKYAARINQKRTVGTSRDRQYSVESDLFLAAPKVVDDAGKMYENASNISILEAKGDTITNIDDVKNYLYRKLLLTLRVPPAYMSIEEQINAKATLTQQDVEYARFRRQLQQLVGQAFKQLFDVQLVLQNIDPDDVANEYEIKWPSINSADEGAGATSYYNEAQGDKIYLDKGVLDDEWIQRNRFQMDDEEIQRLADAKAADEAQQLAAATAAQAATAATGGAPDKGVAQVQQPVPSAKRVEQELALVEHGYALGLERMGEKILAKVGAASNGHHAGA